MFVWGKNDLNPEQEEAIYNENSILLIACPGSGKTRTITYKIAYELSKLESNKQYIVAITYTNRAADEIKERIELLGVDTEQLWIGTIHSFCVEWILKPYHMYIEELRFGYDIINTNDTENYLVSLCASYSTPKKKITYWDCLCYCFTSEGLKINCTKPTIKETVELIIRDYYQNLKEKHEIDYELILYYSYCLLKENKSICKTLSNIFPYILIDEYDHFTNQLLTTYNDPLYEEVTTNASFLCTFFKVIKAGIGEGSIRTCFCTGVLPVTMDDLTNGYNITEILTLEPDFLNMLGFTYKEIEGYLRYILEKYAVGQEHFDETWQLIVSNYAGYRFHPNGESLFNATVFIYFFKNFAAVCENR